MIYRGCYYERFFVFKMRADGQPINISTWQFASDLKDGTDTTVLEMSTGDGQFTVTDGANGVLRFSLTAGDAGETAGLEVGPVTGALYRTDGGNGRQRLLRFSEQVRDQD